MARRPKAIVLDSWAVLAYLEDESTGPKVASLIGDAHEHGIPLLMSVVNAGEVWYIIAWEVSETEADKAIDTLRLLGIEFVDVDWKLARIAGTFKAKNRMSFADCFAAALAKDRKAELVTGDKEFKQVENEVKISWL
ncbi:MAG: type II toxin-antitoxin system VapC family toxin [Proteobacteria bacterium]|nr:type II toxin-antitoxin system VapC family toxin [Pseudomonadota bacterium]